MNKQEAYKRLKKVITPDGNLYSLNWYLSYNKGAKDACLDGAFTADDLEAIAWWIRHSKHLKRFE